MKNCSQSFLFSTKLSQIIRKGCTVTLTVYQDRLSLKGLKKSTRSEIFDKEIDFQTTQYVLNWDYSNHSNTIEGFSLSKHNTRKYCFGGSNDQLSQLKNILKGLIAFSDWEKDYKFVKPLKDNPKCKLILVKQGNQIQVIKPIEQSYYNWEYGKLQTPVEIQALKLIQKNPHRNLLLEKYFNLNQHQLFCFILYFKNKIYFFLYSNKYNKYHF